MSTVRKAVGRGSSLSAMRSQTRNSQMTESDQAVERLIAAVNRLAEAIEKSTIEREGAKEKGQEKDFPHTPHKEISQKENKQTNRGRARRFVEPTAEECRLYATETGRSEAEAVKFHDYFSSNGWKVGGRATMRDWKAAFRNWCRNAGLFKPHARQGVTHGAGEDAPSAAQEARCNFLLDEVAKLREVKNA